MPIDLSTVLSSPRVSDGAWGTELDLLGCPPGFCREEWNLSRPDLVRQVAASYLKAGSQIILTNTFSANRFVLERHGLADKVHAINLTGAQISRQAAGEQAWVFASIGPSGRMVIVQEVSEDELYGAFHIQAKALAAGEPDAIVCESMSELAESLAALRAAKDATGLPVVASMTFDTGSDLRTMMGVAAGAAAQALTEAGADAIGCNCGVGIDACIQVVRTLREHTNLPIWAKPNAGLPEIHGQNTVYRQTPEEFAEKVHLLLEAGASMVGGCCGTTPVHIATLAPLVKTWRPNS
jgi:5-methyltetrahydrofolate--homocysteine methyltransferase